MTERSFSTQVTNEPSESALNTILSGLAGFNAVDVGPSSRCPLAVLVRQDGDDDEVIGGLSGYTAWEWLFIEKLWLPDIVRGRGLGRKLLQDAEIAALERGCHAAWLDTFNPQALGLYQRCGYQIFGELADFPRGRTRFFLKKDLVRSSVERA